MYHFIVKPNGHITVLMLNEIWRRSKQTGTLLLHILLK